MASPRSGGWLGQFGCFGSSASCGMCLRIDSLGAENRGNRGEGVDYSWDDVDDWVAKDQKTLFCFCLGGDSFCEGFFFFGGDSLVV